MKQTKTYPLRLPRSLRQAAERLSREDGISINQFVATAVAEMISALEIARFFADRKSRADFKGFRPYHEATRREAAAAGR